MKDHEIAKLHNDLRNVAINYHEFPFQSLRELIVKLVRPLVEENKKQAAEIAFLQHYASEAYDSFGPCDADIAR